MKNSTALVAMALAIGAIDKNGTDELKKPERQAPPDENLRVSGENPEGKESP